MIEFIHQEMFSTNFLQHELYDGNSLSTEGLPYDIALMEVAMPIEFDARTQPACLPTHDEMSVLGNSDCWISGWGLTKG